MDDTKRSGSFLLAAVSYRFDDVDDARYLSLLSARLGPGDEERLSLDARYHELLPLLHLVAGDCSSLGHPLRLSPATLRRWEEEYNRETIRSTLVMQGARTALASLAEVGITVMPLKGSYLSTRYYRREGARPFRDFDLLVREEDLPGLHSALTGAGFRPLRERPSFVPAPACTVYSLPLEDGRTVTEVDVHVDMHWPEEYRRRTRFRLSEVWEGSRPENWEGFPVRTMQPEHLLVFTLLDLACNHRYARLVKFRDLLEITSSEHVDWGQVINLSLRWEVASLVGPGLYYLLHLQPEDSVPPSAVENLLPRHAAGRLLLRSLPPQDLPAHRSRSLSVANLLFFLLSDRRRERLRSLVYIPRHLLRGLRRF